MRDTRLILVFLALGFVLYLLKGILLPFAVPITSTLKIVCENVETHRPLSVLISGSEGTTSVARKLT